MAAAAIVIIVALVALAAVVKGPLSRVPENAIKFAVGVLLASLGTFWGAERAGAHWAGSDTSLLVIIPLVALASCGLALALRSKHAASSRIAGPSPAAEATQ